MKKAGELYLNGNLALGDGKQTPEEFARQQSSTTGLPVHMSQANMQKNFFVLSHMGEMLDASDPRPAAGCSDQRIRRGSAGA